MVRTQIQSKIALILLICLPAWGQEDKVTLKNGRVVTGIISEENDTTVQVTTKDGAYKFERDNIAEIKRATAAADIAVSPVPSPSPTTTVATPSPTPDAVAEALLQSASPSPSPSPSVDEHVEWTVYLLLGLTTSPSTTYTVKDITGNELGTVKSTDDSGGVLFGAEVDWQSKTTFGMGFTAQSFRYKYNDGTPDDSHLILTAIPRVQSCPSSTCFWGGLGLGFMLTTIGTTSATVSGATVTLDSNKTVGVSISPRVGMDYVVAPRSVLGFQAAYTLTGSTVEGTVTTSSGSAKFKQDFARSWLELALRIGYQF